MAQVKTQPETLSRDEVISAMRNELARRADGEMSICRLAAEQGIFCRGFSQHSDAALAERYAWIVRRDPGITRDALEEVADRWQMALQEVHDEPTSCDVQERKHDTCGGWDDFPNEALSAFLLQLTGRRAVIR